MIAIKALSLSLAALLPLSWIAFDEGQGSAEPDSTIEQLRIGTYVMGSKFDKSDSLGRVVVLEIGGG